MVIKLGAFDLNICINFFVINSCVDNYITGQKSWILTWCILLSALWGPDMLIGQCNGFTKILFGQSRGWNLWLHCRQKLLVIPYFFKSAIGREVHWTMTCDEINMKRHFAHLADYLTSIVWLPVIGEGWMWWPLLCLIGGGWNCRKST